MLRCTNEKCRASLEFNIQALGDRYKLEDGEMTKVKAGKRTKPIEEVYSYQVKCMTCGNKDLVKRLVDAYQNPMKYFDTDNLCECGGEVWNDFSMIKNKQDEELEKEFVGDQRPVTMRIKEALECDRCGKSFNVKG